MIRQAVGISKQLNGWVESLKNSRIKGNKFLTNKEREALARDKDFAEFDAYMDNFRREHLAMLQKRQQDTA